MARDPQRLLTFTPRFKQQGRQALRARAKKPLTHVSKIGAWGPWKEELGEGLAEKVCRKGWRKVEAGLAKSWQRVGGFPHTLQAFNSQSARLEEVAFCLQLEASCLPFVRIHSGNNSKIIFLCICICYGIENNSETISICYAAPSKLQRKALSASATKNKFQNNIRLYLYLLWNA